VDYVVDALNRRTVKKKNGTPSARYLYGSGSKIAAVLDRDGNLAARFVYASHPNTPDFMVLADGTVYRFFCDQLGSPRLIVSSTTGAIAQKISYDAFGTATVQTSGPFPAWQQPFGFAGGLYDEDTGLVRFGARDYDPEVGRWLARDPILFKGGQTNLYVYAGNDPVNKVDPSGEFGFAIGNSGDAGFCFGLCAGSYGVGHGLYLGTEGIGVYATAQVGAGLGGHLGYGIQGSIYTSIDAFSGTSHGVEGVAGFGLIASGELVGNPSGAVLSATYGAGGGYYGGAVRSETRIYGLKWSEVLEALTLAASSVLSAGPPSMCPP
jgi:RHS repeat-associated protein